MAYTTQQDMIDRFGQQELIQLTDRSNTGAIDSVVLGRAMDDADAEIDGYLAVRYTLPLASPPTVLVRIASDIARYHLYDDVVPDQPKERYENAIRFLRAIADGKVDIGVPAQEEEGGVKHSGPDRVFTDETLQDY